MSSASSSDSVASTIVTSRKNPCHQISSTPTKADLTRIKADLQNHTERLQRQSHHILYSWEDNFNEFQIQDYMMRLERRIDKLDFQVEKSLQVNANLLSKFAKVIEGKFLSEKK